MARVRLSDSNRSRASAVADLVMSDYGHSRMREIVFGGVTRALMTIAPIPMLMSH
jgi:nucleotide-binding universal stress UspA family protein